MTPEYLVETATSLYTLEAHVRYMASVPPEARLSVRSSVIGVTDKLLWLWHEMWCDGRRRASEEVLMWVSTARSRDGWICDTYPRLQPRTRDLEDELLGVVGPADGVELVGQQHDPAVTARVPSPRSANVLPRVVRLTW